MQNPRINYRQSNTYANVTFFGHGEKDMPKILRVGDIVRIQQVNCTEYKGQRQFNANLCLYNSKTRWAVYRGTDDCSDKAMYRKYGNNNGNEFITKKSFNEESKGPSGMSPSKNDIIAIDEPVDFDPFEPVQYSGDNYSIHESEKQRITEIREWTVKYFRDF